MKNKLGFQTSFSLKAYNTFGIDVRAAYFASPRSIGEMQELCHLVPDFKRLLVLGGGSNVLLVGDFPGYVIHPIFQRIEVLEENADRCLWRVEAGVNWHFLVSYSLQQGWQGLENLALIPGSVGAAPIQNIGAYGIEIAEFIYAVEGLDLSSFQLLTLPKQACEFGYRDSIFKKALKNKFIVTAIILELFRNRQPNTEYSTLKQELEKMKASPYSTQDVFEAVCRIRRRKLPDPATVGNAGSFFKNPEIDFKHYTLLKEKHPDLVAFALPGKRYKIAAGWLIEKCGWKGRAIGGAAVHPHHALVLVNKKDATGHEILRLAEAIEKDVYENFGITLEREVNVIEGNSF
ncbi:MAG: UDP-N-acetylmuramate dehydrogenase [Bacteroidia bacterium]|nr:UDP-N-acetylmuramate dehydrogenase [Bacteroidia bacterium]MDW8158990.1 UDP-N-acetylmuramate dehydrogenase [Bacteroidia bacterium]